MDENEDGEIDYEDFLNLRCFCMEKLTCEVLHLEGVHSMDLQQAWNVSNLPTRFVSLVSHMSIFFPCSLLQPSPQWWASSPRSPCQCELPLAKTEPRKKKKWWIIDEVPDKSVALYSEIFENRYIECQWYLSRAPAVKWYCSMMLAHVSQIKAAIIPV